MSKRTYANPPGGMPGQEVSPSGRAVFKDAYALIPAEVMRDIVTSQLPGWECTRAWVLARPMSGFSETFAQLIVEVSPGGGSNAPEPDPNGQAAIFITRGTLDLTIEGRVYNMAAGGFAYIPPGANWSVLGTGESPVTFHWIRKSYEAVQGIEPPSAVVTSDDETAPSEMPQAGAVWSTTRFLDTADMAHDMAINIVNFQPGGCIPFEETHVMEHGLYVLEGTAEYNLNGDWVSVGPGDFMWLRAFCPQCCRATGEGAFRYLLYKDTNRHVPLTLR